MRQLLSLIVLFIGLSIVACAGGAERTKPDLQKPDVQIPERTVEKPEITAPGIEPPFTPGARRTPAPHVTLHANPRTPNVTLPANLATPGGTRATLTLPTIASQPVTLPPVTVAKGSPISGYDATQMITTFAQQCLGAQVSVTRAGGVKGNVSVPSVQQAQVDAAVSLAGDTALGLITSGGAQGGAEVAVGSGTISGDLNADISGASFGAYSLVVRAPAPADANASLALVRQYFPALAKANLQPQPSEQSTFVFYATTTHQGVDWKSKQATVVAEAIAAGTNRQGPATIIWVVVGNGTFAASIKP